MFIVILRYPDPEKTLPHQPEHIAFIDRHIKAGHFTVTGPQVPRTGGIIVADVPTRAELDMILLEDPYRKAGTTYEIIEFLSGGKLTAAAPRSEEASS
jgi:uncharacterized protein YciI